MERRIFWNSSKKDKCNRLTVDKNKTNNEVYFYADVNFKYMKNITSINPQFFFKPTVRQNKYPMAPEGTKYQYLTTLGKSPH